MRLREREEFFRKKHNVQTINDVHRERRLAEAAEKAAEERRLKVVKESTKGAMLPGLEVPR
ncbi:MAG: hypothetical protein Q8K67_11190 [Geothrix sp.]|nr:hypothetical protein [Geothrix sp.]